MKLRDFPELEESGYSRLDYIGHGAFGEVFLVQDGEGEKKILKEYYEKLGGLYFVEKAINARRSAVGITPEDVVMPERGKYFEKQLMVLMNHVDGQTFEDIFANCRDKVCKCVLPELVFPFLSKESGVDISIENGVQLVRQYVDETMGKIQLLMDNGLVHGDIKADNVMARRGGGATLIDFDFMLRQDVPLDDDDVLSWDCYSPPEGLTAEGSMPSRSYDIYSLGMSAMVELFGYSFLKKLDSALKVDIVPENPKKVLNDFLNRLYDIPLTGSPIVSGRIRRDLVEKLPDYLRWEVHGLVEFGIAALNRDPEARPKSAEEVRQLLEMRPSSAAMYYGPASLGK